MKKLLFIALALLTLGSTFYPTYAQKKKKEIKWDWDGKKSGDETIDNYLICIDTIYRNIQQYKEQMDSYELCDTTLFINGKYYKLAYMLNGQGELVTRGQVNWQCAHAVMDAVNIVLDITNAQLATASATLALPNLGLKALSFGKYVKGGAAVFVQGIKEIKAIRGKWVGNSRTWKGMKNGAVEDPAALGYFDEESLAKINKCCYLKEFSPEDPAYEQIQTTFKDKSDEEKAAEAEAFAKEFAQRNIAPEDASKQLDDISDDELNRELGDTPEA